MQAELATACRRSRARWAGLGVPPGISFRQACNACSNCGEPRLSEPAEITPCAFGSGKLGSPFARMQAANFVSCCTLPVTEKGAPIFPLPPVAAPELPAAAADPDTLLVGLDAVVVPRLATAGEPEPPQPASASPRLAAIATRTGFPTTHREAAASKTVLKPDRRPAGPLTRVRRRRRPVTSLSR